MLSDDDTDEWGDLKLIKENIIGHGRFGTVFKTRYKNSPCAAKLLSANATDIITGGVYGITSTIQQEALISFFLECSLLKKLNHDNITCYIATVTEPISKYLPVLVMELMDYSLKKYLEVEATALGSSFQLQIQLCLDVSQGLAYLHENKIIHRDLCDDNVLIKICDRPKAKIGDFGMSKILKYDLSSISMTGLAQREVYIPSEAREDPTYYNYSLDIYSFGVIATQILVQRSQFKRKDDVNLALPGIKNTDLNDLVCSCLHEERDRRPTAHYIVSKISSILQHLHYSS